MCCSRIPGGRLWLDRHALRGPRGCQRRDGEKHPGRHTCGTDCSQAYAVGTLVSLKAAIPAGSRFAGRSGVCTGTVTTCTVAVSANLSVTATFALLGPADLVVTTVSDPPAAAMPGGRFSIRDTVSGSGETTALTPRVGYSLSTTGAAESGMPLTGTRWVPSLAAAYRPSARRRPSILLGRRFGVTDTARNEGLVPSPPAVNSYYLSTPHEVPRRQASRATGRFRPSILGSPSGPSR